MNNKISGFIAVILIIAGMVFYNKYQEGKAKEAEEARITKERFEQARIAEMQRIEAERIEREKMEAERKREAEKGERVAYAKNRVAVFSRNYIDDVSPGSGEGLSWAVDTVKSFYNYDTKTVVLYFTTTWRAYMETYHPDEIFKSSHQYDGKLTVYANNEEILETVAKNEALIKGEASIKRTVFGIRLLDKWLQKKSPSETESE